MSSPSAQPSPTLISLAAGETLCGRYRLEEQIGRGGMGVVWRATDTMLGETVALKCLPAALTGDKRSVARLKDEAKRCLRLSHPNIVRLNTFEQDASRGNLAFLVMQCIAGRSLDDLIADDPQGLPAETVERIARDVAAAIDHAHGQDPLILHRDIKPANIMIDPAGRALLMDFGIACEVRLSMTRLTGQDASSGTLLYMSPQHLQGEPPSKTDDLYSLAATLYEALSGNPPFTHGDLAHQIRFKPPPPLTRGPEWLRDRILRGLAKAPGDRPGSAAQLVQPAAVPGSHPAAPAVHLPTPAAAGGQVPSEVAELLVAAEQGNAVAQNNLGICYSDGRGVDKSVQKAVEWYRKAAEQGNAVAQNNLGICYSDGRGVDKSVQKAVEWYRKAAEQGHATAQHNLGMCYFNGTGVDTNLQKAFHWFRKAAERGSAGARYALGVCYDHGTGVAKDEKKAFEWFRKAAESGNTKAQYAVGVRYDHGTGVEKDERAAVVWYRKAAMGGETQARDALQRVMRARPTADVLVLSAEFHIGEGVSEAVVSRWLVEPGARVIEGQPLVELETDKAIVEVLSHRSGVIEILHGLPGEVKHVGDSLVSFHASILPAPGGNVPSEVAKHLAAAEQGNADAQYNLGQCYFFGRGVEKDDNQAVEWYRRAAEQGNARAQHNLGRRYSAGFGVEKNDKEAFEWYRRAAEQGHAEAKFDLLTCYAASRGVDKAENKVVEWFRETAEQGDAGSQLNLGVCYANGYGVEKDEKKAVEWFRKAAEQGNSAARDALNRLKQP